MALGVVRDGALEFFHGHGFADLESRTPVTEDTVFRIGSLTKTITAIAILQLRDQGLLDLDAPAEQYLRAYRLIPAAARHRPPTVRHLLTHTAGLAELLHPTRALSPVLGETVPFGRRVPPLAEFYRGRLRLVAEPGTTFTYSNHGFATLGQIIEDLTATPLDRYLREHVFEPLGMTHTDLGRSARVSARLATGYELRSRGPRPVGDVELVTSGAGGVYSTMRDMARYLAALQGRGSDILPAATLAELFTPHYQPDPRLPGMGLAFFRHDLGGHPVVEHDGVMPGFNSLISLAPHDRTGIAVFTNGAHGAHLWLGTEVAGILRRLLEVADPHVRTGLAHRPETWNELCGWYSFRGSPRDVQKWFIAGARVLARHGRLVLRPVTPIPALARGLPLHPDDDADPYVFRVDLSAFGLGTSRVIFTRSPGGGVSALHLEFAPMSFDKRARGRTPA
ncbi:beta-lactamase family protein [Amycolatopsis sp. K13G38]|uniref:Beta-lactamase family protein n=2 Tax=Amycolatopsis acididurans TaxID=2724524 RepID=A0ABX1J8M7_9PSEU|nr:beta-lactamase family protein [Amycolatopsis acididurans]